MLSASSLLKVRNYYGIAGVTLLSLYVGGINMNNNINLLKQNYPNIYKNIIKTTPNKNTYEIIKTKTNQSTLKIKDKDKSYFLHSKYNPSREAENIARENYEESIENYIIFGLGFGYHVERLMAMAPSANFYIIETNK